MPETYKHKYNLVLNRQLSDLDLELYCFLNDHPPERGGLGKAGHFRAFVEAVWGPGGTKHFIWHPWAEQMLEEMCNNQYLGIIGCGSSGKTDMAAIWAIVNWLAARFSTKVLVTSTSLKESKKRIWGSIVEYYMAARILPGKLVDSLGQIRSSDSDTDDRVSDKSGIELISGEKRKEREAIGKLIGIKNKRVIMIADELPELSEALLSASFSNLALNPYFQFIGIGNFNSIYDPLGIFVCPKMGYASITVDDTRWETERGVCIRFDGMKSPNILSGRDEWPIYNGKDLINHRRTLGETTSLFWRMCRSFPCPEGEENAIYTEADMMRGRVHEPVIWMENPIPVAAIDPGFTSGGDRSVAATGMFGRNKDGIQTLMFTGYHILQEDLSIRDDSRNIQIAKKFIKLCNDKGVQPVYAAYDATAGGGIMYGEILSEFWSSHCLGVNFGGLASDLTVSSVDTRVGREAYANRVSELWCSGVPFVRAGQIKGMPTDMAIEWKSRRFTTMKSDTIRTRVESKTDMKLRTGKSPDIGDAGVMLLTLCRERLNFTAGGIEGAPPPRHKNWDKATQHWDQVYTTAFEEAYA